MTVCIAAVCNSIAGRQVCVIAAADRMITIGDIEYEPEQTKSVFFADNTIGLFAGDMQLHVAIIPRVHARIKDALHENPRNINVSQIAEFYAEEFAFYRRTLAEREILVPRGLSFDRFLTRQATMAHWQVNDLDSRLASYYIGSTAIIAGIDPTGGHVYKITDPGVATCFDTPFFACAGAGEFLATTQFMVGRYDKTWPVEKALWLTFTAKARAEMAGGVGKQTDLVVISAGQRHILSEDEKKELYDLFARSSAQEDAASNAAVAEVRKRMEALAAKEIAASQKSSPGGAPQDKAGQSAEPQPKLSRRKKTGPK